MKCLLAYLVLFSIIACDTANAETLRCRNKIVDTGMSMSEVLKYCGNPSSKTVEEHDVRSGNRVVGTTEMHIWRYNRASGQNAADLYFDQDKLMRISFVRK